MHRLLDVDAVHRPGERRDIVGVKTSPAAQIRHALLARQGERAQQLLGRTVSVSPGSVFESIGTVGVERVKPHGHAWEATVKYSPVAHEGSPSDPE